MRWQEFMSLEHRRLDERREGKLRRALGDPLPGETKEQLERIGERDRLMARHGLVALVGAVRVDICWRRGPWCSSSRPTQRKRSERCSRTCRYQARPNSKSGGCGPSENCAPCRSPRASLGGRRRARRCTREHPRGLDNPTGKDLSRNPVSATFAELSFYEVV